MANLEHRDYLVRLASKNICDGVIEEPRMFFDYISIDTTSLTVPLMPANVGGVSVDLPVFAGHPNVFRNGERFPMRITHMTAAIRSISTTTDTPLIAEDILDSILLQITGHDNFYMARQFSPLPLWQNVPVAAPDIVTKSSASWTFARPYILSTRDTMKVTLYLEEALGADLYQDVNVTFHGIGMVSRRPYVLTGSVQFSGASDVGPTIVDIDRYRNDGGEPIVMTDMCINCGPLQGPSDPLYVANDPIGDIRNIRVQVRQQGNGTNVDWAAGPIGSEALAGCPAALCGVTSGRVLVHEFPGDGLIWEPGEGISLAVQNTTITPSSDDIGDVLIGLFGYIAIPG